MANIFLLSYIPYLLNNNFQFYETRKSKFLFGIVLYRKLHQYSTKNHQSKPGFKYGDNLHHRILFHQQRSNGCFDYGRGRQTDEQNHNRFLFECLEFYGH